MMTEGKIDMTKVHIKDGIPVAIENKKGEITLVSKDGILWTPRV
jgi:hypothetical protein